MSNGSNRTRALERLVATERNTEWCIETCAYLIFCFFEQKVFHQSGSVPYGYIIYLLFPYHLSHSSEMPLFDRPMMDFRQNCCWSLTLALPWVWLVEDEVPTFFPAQQGYRAWTREKTFWMPFPYCIWHYRPLLTPSAWPRLLRSCSLSIPASSLSACVLILSSCLLCESIAHYHHLLPFFLGFTSFHTLHAAKHIFTYRGQRGRGKRRRHGVEEWMCEKEGRRELHQYVSFHFYSPEPRHGWHPL